MKVYVVIEHYDRGSDEVAVRGVFRTKDAANAYVVKHFAGWAVPEDDGGYVRQGWYEDPEDTDSSDRVWIDENELEG